MGFYLDGLKPNAEIGIYFCNNGWWWRPLAEYVLAICDDIFLEGETEYWQSNDGQEVSAETAQKIAERLKANIESGRTQRYANKYQAEQATVPQLVCQYCNGTGERKDLEPPEWKKECGGCNACHGAGKVNASSTMYPFSEENVKKFAEFCEASGGFEIY